MKKTIKKIIIILFIVIMTFVLGYVGVGLDKQMWAENTTDNIGHPAPVFTMLLPMFWLGLWMFIGIISIFIKIIKSVILKLRTK